MPVIDFSGGCHAPITVEVMARTCRFGVYDLAVWRHRRTWHWAVLLADLPIDQGTSRTEAAAYRCAEAAATRTASPRLL